MNILTMLLREWKLTLAGIFLITCFILYGMYSYQCNKVLELEKENVKLQVTIERKDAEYKSLSQSVENQNNSIRELNIKLGNKQKEIDNLNIELSILKGEHDRYVTDFATTTIITKEIALNCLNNKITRKDGSEEVNKQWLKLIQK